MSRCLLALLALALPLTASAGAPSKFPMIDASSPDTLLDGAKDVGFKVEGKAKSEVKKIAIAGFQVRYNFESAMGVKIDSKQYGMSTTVTTTSYTWAEQKLETAEYRALTELLYDQVVAALVAEGFEVVDRATVTASAAYGAIEEGKEKEKDDWAKDAPEGFKALPMYLGRPMTKREAMAAVTKEVGADATIAVALNVGMCAFEGEKKWREGVSGPKVCVIGPPGAMNAQTSGLNIEWYGGAEDGKDGVDEAWHARAYKYHQTWNDKKVGAIYDMPVVLRQDEVEAFRPTADTTGMPEHLVDFAVNAEATVVRAVQAQMAVWKDKNG